MSGYQSQFAPYTPPPDDPQPQASVPAPSSNARFKRPWFPANSSSQTVINSYQSGGIPTFSNSQAGGSGAVDATEAQTSQWETRFHMKVDALASFAYLLGPISALGLLVLETQNDYVRFHAYQSALLTTPLLCIRIFASLVGLPNWIRTFLTIVLVVSAAYMSFRAHRDAARNNLARFQLPVIGEVADRWVADE